MVLRAGLDRCGKSRPNRVYLPARRQSLYRLRYSTFTYSVKRLEHETMPFHTLAAITVNDWDLLTLQKGSLFLVKVKCWLCFLH